MGSDFSSWTDVTGPIYMGANSQWEMNWTIVAAGICVFALIVGAIQEKTAYGRAERRRNNSK